MTLVNDWKPKMVFLSETHVSSDMEPVELNIDGYCLKQCVTNNRRTGEVLVLIRIDVKYKVKTVKCIDNYVWILSVEVSISRTRYLFSVLYHPPQTENARFVEYYITT